MALKVGTTLLEKGAEALARAGQGGLARRAGRRADGGDRETRVHGAGLADALQGQGRASASASRGPIAVPLDEVKAVGKALGASVNDVLLSCVAGALREYLVAQGRLRATE